MKIITVLFGNRDGSFSLPKLLWACGTMQYLALSAWDVIHKGINFDMQSFGIGLGAVMAAHGAALLMNQKKEGS